MMNKKSNLEQMKLNYGAERHHYSMFKVGRSMFIFFSKLSAVHPAQK